MFSVGQPFCNTFFLNYYLLWLMLDNMFCLFLRFACIGAAEILFRTKCSVIRLIYCKLSFSQILFLNNNSHSFSDNSSYEVVIVKLATSFDTQVHQSVWSAH